MNFFNFKINVGEFRDKVLRYLSHAKDTLMDYFTGRQLVDPKKMEDAFRTGALEAVSASKINYTKRVIDIVNGFRVDVKDYGKRGQSQFIVRHDFLEGQDPTWTTQVRKKIFKTKGSTVLRSIEWGRQAFIIYPRNHPFLLWGYPYPKHKRMSQMSHVPKKGIYMKGIGMIPRGTQRLKEYFATIPAKIRRGVSSLKGL